MKTAIGVFLIILPILAILVLGFLIDWKIMAVSLGVGIVTCGVILAGVELLEN